jgi:hypothetical protein
VICRTTRESYNIRTDSKSGWSLNRKNFSPLISKR